MIPTYVPLIYRVIYFIVPVDSVTGDGHKMTLGCHNVTQQGKVAVVHVQAVEIQHLVRNK